MVTIAGGITQNKRNQALRFFRFMGRIMKSDNLIRPRRNIGARNETIKFGGNVPIFKMGENEFTVPIPASQTSVNNTFVDGKLVKKKEDKFCKYFPKMLIHHLEQYCDKTTLHGLRYVGDNTLTIGERLFWLFAFACAISFGAYYISNIYEKWSSSPVIISFSPFDADLSSIPFPAVTICNMNQVKKTEAERLIAEGDPVQLRLLNDACHAKDQHSNDTTQYNWATLSNFLIRTGTSCSEMIKSCQWSNEIKNCEDLFNNDLTDEGLCCSFNRLPPNKIFRNLNDISLLNQSYPENVFDWNPETGFDGFPLNDPSDENVIPKRPLGAGAHLGLTVVLDAKVDNYFCSSTSSVGFKILISNPIETPKMADFGSLLRPGVEVRYSISPSVREASDKLRDIPLEKRQCYFANERRLQYYRTYTKQNCQAECASTNILKFCGCIPYYLPKNDSIKYCYNTDETCVQIIKRMVAKKLSQRNFCGCFVECESLTFSQSLSYSQLNKFFGILPEHVSNLSEEYISKNILALHFFFNSNHYNRIFKAPLMDDTDFVGNIGSLLGVFLGFGMLFVAEVFFSIWTLIKEIYYKGRKPAYPYLN